MAGWYAKTVQEVATFLGLDAPRTVQGYFARGCPGKTPGGYDLRAIVGWCKAHVWCDKRSGGEGSPKEAAELRKLEAEAVIKEAKAQQVLGNLVDRALAGACFSRAMTIVSNRMQAMPAEAATLVPPQDRDDFLTLLEGKVAMALKEAQHELLAHEWNAQEMQQPSATDGKSRKRVSRKSPPARTVSRRTKSRTA